MSLMLISKYFSYIVVVSFIGAGNGSTGRKPLSCRKSMTNFIKQCCIEYTSQWAQFERTITAVIGTYCICSYQSSYYTSTTTRLPQTFFLKSILYKDDNYNISSKLISCIIRPSAIV